MRRNLQKSNELEANWQPISSMILERGGVFVVSVTAGRRMFCLPEAVSDTSRARSVPG
jgi:hypothetical protein